MNNKYIELQALITEREGMVAQNDLNKQTCEDIIYNYWNFKILADKIRALIDKEEEKPHA